MELSFLFYALLLFLFVVKFLQLAKPKNKSSKNKLPPGPRKLPFIGNIHQLFGSSLPHHTLRNLANKHGPLMHLQLGELPVVVVSSPVVAKEVFRTHDIIFSNRPCSQASWTLLYNHSDIAFAPYGDLWRQLRKICTLELLTAKRVLSFRCIREEEVINMMRSIIQEEEHEHEHEHEHVVNLSKMIYSLNYTIIARAAFGKKSIYHEEIIAVAESAMRMLGGFHISDMFPSYKILQLISGYGPKLERIHQKLDKIVETVLKEHREKVTNHVSCSWNEERKEDFVDVLLNIQKHSESEVPLTDKIIKAVIFDMFSAGGENSSTTIEWAISEMIRNPKIMKRAQMEVRQVFCGKGNVEESMLDELKYLQAVVKETFRLHPPAVLLGPRECGEQCEINGYEIPSKTTVLINAWAIGRDPKCWVDAHKFDPDRFLDSTIDFKGNHFEFVPFGGGRRICPGISYAIPNIQLSLAQLLFHFDWKLPGENLDMTEIFGLTVKRKNELQLIPIPYQHSCFKGKQ